MYPPSNGGVPRFFLHQLITFAFVIPSACRPSPHSSARPIARENSPGAASVEVARCLSAALLRFRWPRFPQIWNLSRHAGHAFGPSLLEGEAVMTLPSYKRW